LHPPHGIVDHRGKILLQLLGRLPAQAIVAAQLQHHHPGLCAASSAGSRAWPPALVSPLIEALTT
jgi:hypothetical protein